MQTIFNNPPPGELVNIDGYNMHVFTQGDGEKTLVFLAGHGTAYPTLDFKPLWSQLVDNFKIAVVERFGYGYSSKTKTSRDLYSVLSNTREALKLAGLTPPYVLVPHSLSGLEAIYWAQKFPDEVEAMVMLDPNLPEMAEAIKPNIVTRIALKLISRASQNMSVDRARTAIVDRNPSNTYKLLSEDDQEVYIDVFRSRTYTPDMLREIKDLPINIKLVKSLSIPADVPLLLFSSNFGGDAKYAHLLKFHKDFVATFRNAKHIELECGHYVHSYVPEQIAEEIKTFMNPQP